MNTNITIRKATAADCSRMMELVNELAVYERAPQELPYPWSTLYKVALVQILYGGHLWPKRLAPYRALRYTISVTPPGRASACISKTSLLLNQRVARVSAPCS